MTALPNISPAPSRLLSMRPAPTGSEADRRARRVTVVLIGVLALSVADLFITVFYLRTIGMFEANPVAAFLMESTGSPAAIVGFKMLSLLVSVGTLYLLRRFAVAELAAWVAFIVLIVLSYQWYGYAQVFSDAAMLLEATQGFNDDNWIRWS